MRNTTTILLVTLLLTSLLASLPTNQLNNTEDAMEASGRSGADVDIISILSPDETECTMVGCRNELLVGDGLRGDDVRGDELAEALVGADVCVAFSRPGPDVIRPDWVSQMAPRAVVFACANPVPEIWPWEAHEAGAAVVATGRSDFPNQLNNSLCFPGMFRGVLDVRARRISDQMALAAARALAEFAQARGIDEDSILPRMDE